jgi:hypothetical protein
MERKLHPKARKRSYLPYSRSGDASSANRGRLESCARRISQDLVGFRIRWCGFMSVPSKLRLSSLTLVAALVRWSFRAL